MIKYIIIGSLLLIIITSIFGVGFKAGSDKEEVICKTETIQTQNEQKQVIDNTNAIIIKSKKNSIINNNFDRDALIRKLQE